MDKEKIPHKPKKFSESESLVAQALIAQGWRILARNYRVVGSELDIVAQKGGTLAIIEVKARAKRPNSLADAEILLPQRKRDALKRGGLAYLTAFSLNPQTIRFDLAIVWGKEPFCKIEYLVNVI